MSNNLPPIGRSGIIRAARKLSGNIVPGWRDVDPTTEFIQGMIATLSGGKVTLADDTADTKIIGLFNCHKTSSFYRPVIDEVVVGGGDGEDVALNNVILQSGSVKVTKSDGTTVLTGGGDDYTVNLIHGLIKLHAGGSNSLTGTETVLVDYRYKDPNHAGLDMTLGSGKASTIEGVGEIATLVYETDAAWAENAAVTVSANGMPTIGGTGTKIGFVTKVPTAEDPELHFQMRLAQ